MAVWSVRSLVPVPSVYPVERYKEPNRDQRAALIIEVQCCSGAPLIELDGRASLGPEAKVDTTLPLWGLACGGMGLRSRLHVCFPPAARSSSVGTSHTQVMVGSRGSAGLGSAP